MRLLFLGGMIFRVLRKVAMRARLGNMLDDARTILRLALLQLDLEGGIAASGHRNLFHHLFCPSIVRAAIGPARTSHSSISIPGLRDEPAGRLIFGPVRGHS